ncbi:hypothetical protein RJT34_21607 [Clitoria ternatea]|uniref:GRF-type domain-containing protein n=1 Tax=Clitoria ternatea TaxID=43366 RepID=A0AAN9IUE8_CLITE
MPLSPSSPPSTTSSRLLQLHPTTPEKPSRCSSNFLKGGCFWCPQQGHWVQSCPFKSPNNTTSPKLDSPVYPNTEIQCRCGHGACVIKIANTEKNKNRKYFACPIKRGARCNNGGFLKWCDDEHIDQSYFQPPPFKYPECECGAGVCRRVMRRESPNVIKYFFTCPVKKNHGSCGYVVSEDEFLRLFSSQSIVPTRQGRQRTLHYFWEGHQNDGTNNELGKGDGMLVQTKRMRIMDFSKGSSSVALSENPKEEDAGTAVEAPEEEDAGAAVEAAQAEHVGFPEFEVPDDDLKFANSVPCDAIQAEALTTQSTHSRIHQRQIMFQRHLFGFLKVLVNATKLLSTVSQDSQLSTGCLNKK